MFLNRPTKEDRVDLAVLGEREVQQDLSDILEYGTEGAFVAMLKMHKPDIGNENCRCSLFSFMLTSARSADFSDQLIELSFRLPKSLFGHTFSRFRSNTADGVDQRVQGGL
jgi:hypothetical protein